MNDGKLYTCPSCGFLTYTKPVGGSYDICSICGWEDDPVQLKYPGYGGGANKESLNENQENILKKIPVHIEEYEGYKRNPTWRPLKKEEIIVPKRGWYSGLNYFHDSVKKPPKFYWLKDGSNK